tara:strand:- start:32 stop:1756 length:1725 start_codon:yes stop_codon:yes gene_type:complete
MPSDVKRKLAAIMFTDISGYTALSSMDENKALKLLDKQEEILTPIIEKFNGTLHNRIGDGLLFTFPTVTDAIKCGIKIQKDTKEVEDLNLRIGIHEGEITLKNGDALGDDVNVASRIDPFAAEGGIVISGKVQQNISSLPEFKTKFVSEPLLKGVKQDVKVFCIVSHGLPETDISKVTAKLERDVKTLWFNQKSIIKVIAIISVLTIGIILWINKNTFEVESIINKPVDIFIVSVQSEHGNLKASEKLMRGFLGDEARLYDKEQIKIDLINQDQLNELYQDIIINATAEFYNEYDVVSLEDMQSKLAKKGVLINFNEVPSSISVMAEAGGMRTKEQSDFFWEKFSSIEMFLTKEFEKNPIYMFKIYAYTVNPPIDNQNIIGFVDFLRIDGSMSYQGFDTTTKDFGKDVTDLISTEISKIFYEKYPSTIISVDNNEVIIKINELAKPKKMSTFNSILRIYQNSADSTDIFYKRRLGECERMQAYCDTTQSESITELCHAFYTNEFGIYFYSKEEYNDLLNNNYRAFNEDGSDVKMAISTKIIIQEVFDSTAIGIIDNSDSLPWIQIRKGDKLVLK